MSANCKLVITSEYVGDQNCSDELYETSDIERVHEIFVRICNELIKVDLYQSDCLKPNELVIGLDTGLYNFVMKSSKAYYVDFFPPRHRIESGRRLNHSEVITDYPAPRSEAHGKHLLNSFYTRNGLWIHALSHFWAALDSNETLTAIWAEKASDFFLDICCLLKEAGLEERIKLLQDNYNSPESEFSQLRRRYYDHRTKFYQQNSHKGAHVKEYEIRDDFIYKQYFINTSNLPFTDNSKGEKMLNDCYRYYDILKNEIQLTVPQTSFRLTIE